MSMHGGSCQSRRTITAIPRDVRMKRAWIRPYNSSEALSIMSLCSSVSASSVTCKYQSAHACCG
eukprot:COSAG01_NODE_1445_length_10281_cov_33.445099_4_plen_64_part_00